MIPLGQNITCAFDSVHGEITPINVIVALDSSFFHHLHCLSEFVSAHQGLQANETC